MNAKLFNAILSMDAYNRGYNSALEALSNDVQDTIIGDASIIRNKGDAEAINANYYAVAYDRNGTTIISYRGTDDPAGTITSSFFDGDIWNGWTIGAGNDDAQQAELAIRFYQDVVDQVQPTLTDYTNNGVVLTGHSLGGGLAGYIGGLYANEADIFDNMTFERAANNTYTSTDTDLLDLVYPGFNHAPDFTKIEATSIAGEILKPLRPFQTTPDNALELGNNVDLSGIVSESVARHSMSTLAIRMFADTEIGGAIQWREAAKHFWPKLYNDSFAFSVGMNDPGLAGTLQTAGQYSDILRMIIAYSAIDNGADNTSARPFGDTGIRAFYDDANNLGAALTASGAGSAIETHAEVISRAFLNFSGQLALNKVLQSGAQGSLALNGILTYSDQANNKMLTVDLSEPYWQLVTGSADHNAESSRFELVSSVLIASGIGGEVLSHAAQIWGDGTYNAFDRVAFAAQQNATTVIAEPAVPSEKATLFIGGSGNDTVTGSSADEMFIGGAGDDVIDGGGGDDIIISGAGDDTYVGGDGFDTLSYANERAAINIDFRNDLTGEVSLVTDGTGGTDTLSGWHEHIIGTDFDDVMDLYSNPHLFQAGQHFDGGKGIDTLGFGSYDLVIKDGVAYVGDGSIATNFERFDSQSVADFAFSLVHIHDLGHEYFGSATFDYSSHHTGLTAMLDIGRITDGSDTDTVEGGVTNFIGTSFGDTVYLGRGMATLGTGNDTVFAEDGSQSHRITYTGGNDVVETSNQAAIAELFMDRSISVGDVTISEINVVFSDHYVVPENNHHGVDVYTFDLRVQVSGKGQIIIKELDKHVWTEGPQAGTIREIEGPKILFADGQYYNPLHELIQGHDSYEGVGSSADEVMNASLMTTNPGSLAGNGGNDTLIADTDTWVLHGGAGDDILHGSSINNTLEGGSGSDQAFGGAGDDTIAGGLGNDILDGGADNDTIYGGIGADRIIGGAGNDHLYGGDLDTVDLDNDTAVFSGPIGNYSFASAGDTIEVTDNVGTDGTDVIASSIEYLEFGGLTISISDVLLNTGLGTANAEILDGSALSDLLVGFAGNDILNGFAGDDQLYSGIGNDTLNGGSGQNTLHGADGDDIYVWEPSGGNDTIIETSGNDEIQIGPGVVRDDLEFARQGDDLLITQDGSISIRDFYTGDTIETLRFNDGSTFNLASLSLNQSPDAVSDSFSVNEDSQLTGNVLANDTDLDNDTLSVVPGLITTAQGGVVNLSANGHFTYVPAANFFGLDSFDYTLLDRNTGQNTAQVTIDVLPLPDAPIAANDNLSGPVDAQIVGNVLLSNGNGADQDPDNDILSVTPATFTTAQGGSISIQANGNFTYTPALSFSGTDSFDYTVADGTGRSDTATVTLSIIDQNTPPIAIDDRFSGAENAQITGNVIADNGAGADRDLNSDPLSVLADTITTVQGGSVALLANGDFTYTPPVNYTGPDSFEYTLSDGTGGIDTGSVTFTIGPPLPTIDGTASGETLNGTSAAENINGLDGHDTIYADEGDDVVSGHDGNDQIFGEAGADILYGADGNDQIDGGAGDDLLYGGAGDDAFVFELERQNHVTLNGTTSSYVRLDDTASMPSNEMTINISFRTTDIKNSGIMSYAVSSNANEIVLFKPRSLEVYIDNIPFATGLVLNDGQWHDLTITWKGSNGELNVYNHGQLVYTNAQHVGTVLNANGVLILGQEQDSVGGGFQSSQAFDGDISEFAMWDRVLSGSEVVSGPAVNDALFAYDFNEESGNTVNDLVGNRDATLVGAQRGFITTGYTNGVDSIYDIQGNDKIVFGVGIAVADVTFRRLNAGNDLEIFIQGVKAGTIFDQFTLGTIETLEFDDGTILPFSGIAIDTQGTAGADTLNGVPTGASIHEDIYGDAGNDLLYGNTGNDNLYGGSGWDTANYENATSGVTASLLDGEASNDGDGGIDTFFDIENLQGSAHSDTLIGDDNANAIFGGDGNDVINGLKGSDQLTGGAGADTFIFDTVKSHVVLNGTTSSYVRMSDTAVMPTTAMSIEVSFRTTDTKSAGIMSYAVSANANEIILLNPKSLDIYIDNIAFKTGLAFNDGEWHDLVVTWNQSGQVQLYDGGTLVYSHTIFVGTVLTANGVVILGQEQDSVGGGFQSSQAFDGEIRSFGMWDRVLSSTEIETGPPVSNALFAYDFQDGQGAVAQDIVGSRDATLFNIGWSFAGDFGSATSDTITDFRVAEGDVIDISDVLFGYDPLTDAITDFVQITDSGVDSIVSVDSDGGGDNFVQIVTLKNVTGLTNEEALETNGTLIAA